MYFNDITYKQFVLNKLRPTKNKKIFCEEGARAPSWL